MDIYKSDVVDVDFLVTTELVYIDPVFSVALHYLVGLLLLYLQLLLGLQDGLGLLLSLLLDQLALSLLGVGLLHRSVGGGLLLRVHLFLLLGLLLVSTHGFGVPIEKS